MVTDNRALVTAASEEHDETCDLDFDLDDCGRHAELCFTIDMAKVVLSEQQCESLRGDQVTAVRMCLGRSK
eukprot:9477852-Pyramimonas_sp.AAC.1